MTLKPKDRAEEIALFRHGIIAQLAGRELLHGELRAEFIALSEQRFRPPGADSTRTYSIPTLERWYYAYKKDGLEGLKPKRRSDRGFAQKLHPELVRLLLDIRREFPTASVPLILRTLIADGRLETDSVSAATVRRLYRAHRLDRESLKARNELGRRRWEAAGPNAIWHGDVCHFGKIRIHGLLDDASRFVLGLEAFHKEREEEMIQVLGGALYRNGLPDTLYLDNGSTYRGSALSTACGRLEFALVHARPYDPQARGKMERFWRTLRQDFLNFVPGDIALHDLNVRLITWLQAYHARPHGGLMGKTPQQVYVKRPRPSLDELQTAFAVRKRRKIRKDNTLSFDGTQWETDQSHLAGKNVDVTVPLLALGCKDPRPWLEVEGQRHRLEPVDPVANGRAPRKRTNASETRSDIAFEPADAVFNATFKRTTP